MNNSISIKQILFDLISIREQVIEIFQNKTEYRPILDFLNAKDYYNDEDIAYPTLLEIEKSTGLNSYWLRKHLKKMYDSLFNTDGFDKLTFNQTEIWFYLSYFKKYGSFTVKNLNHIPKVGENITIPFLKAQVGTNWFYVESVRHTFEQKHQRIEITLKNGIFNSYWYLRKHEALEKREIG